RKTPVPPGLADPVADLALAVLMHHDAGRADQLALRFDRKRKLASGGARFLMAREPGDGVLLCIGVGHAAQPAGDVPVVAEGLNAPCIFHAKMPQRQAFRSCDFLHRGLLIPEKALKKGDGGPSPSRFRWSPPCEVAGP